MKKRISSMLLAVIMCMGMLLGISLTASAADASSSVFSGGSGTESAPYLISTKDDLFAMAEAINNDTEGALDAADSCGLGGYHGYYFKQTADIDLSGVNWTPFNFCGIYDGDGFKIENLTVNEKRFDSTEAGTGEVTQNEYEAAFFGQLVHAEIRNLTFENCTASIAATLEPESGRDIYVGIVATTAIAARFENIKTVNCTVVQNAKEGNFGYAGGLVGYADICNFTRCAVESGSITIGGNAGSSQNAGGIAGGIGDMYYEYMDYYNMQVGAGEDFGIFNCSVDTDISVNGGESGYAGGIVGMTVIDFIPHTIQNCYIEADITAGIAAGINGYGCAKDSVENCFANIGTFAGNTKCAIGYYGKNYSTGEYIEGDITKSVLRISATTDIIGTEDVTYAASEFADGTVLGVLGDAWEQGSNDEYPKLATPIVYPDGTIIIPLDANGIPTSANGTGWTYDSASNTLTLTNGNSYAVDGECEAVVNNSGTIVGGAYNKTVNNIGDSDTTYKEALAVIDGGIFNGEVINGDGFDTCTINSGTFNGKVTNKNRGVVNDGIFMGEFSKILGSTVNGGTFVVEFVVNGGTWTDGYTAPTTYTYTAGLALPTSENISNGTLSFDGWYDNEEFSGLPVTAIPTNSFGKLTFYVRFVDGIATWEAAGNLAAENTDYTVDADGNYTVLTAKGLAKIANIVNGGDSLSGKTVTLANNIDLLDGGVYQYGKDTVTERNSWIPINGFAGTFDGNGKKIDNLYVLTTNKDAGLFGSNAGTIKDLEIASGKVTINVSSGSELQAGGIAASTSGLIDNCINRVAVYANDTSGSGWVYIGGITGLVSTSTGGATVSTVSNCTNYGAVSSLGNSSCGIYGGGIAGTLYAGMITGRTSLIDKCVNEGTVDIEPGSSSWAGGIAGCVRGHSNTSIYARLLNSKNTAVVGGTHAGGITGYNRNVTFVYNNYNTGNITGGTNAGGIVGLNYYANSSVANCYSTGTASGATNNGGIVGNLSNGSVANCYYLDTAASAVAGKIATGKDPINSAAFATSNGTHTLASAVYETTDLLTALKAWVTAQNSTEYMTWKADAQNSNYPVFAEIVTYTVTFAANGGTVGTASATTGTDGKLISLPTPTRTGYIFNGWFDAKTGGNAVTVDKIYTADTTIYAQWQRDTSIQLPIYVDGSSGNDANDGLTTETAVKTLKKAIELAWKNGTIIVMKAVALTPDNMGSGNVTLEDLTVERWANNTTGDLLVIQGSQTAPMKVTLKNITLDGKKIDVTDNFAALVRLGAYAELNVEAGAKLVDNNGIAVYVSDAGAKASMTGGEISGNYTNEGSPDCPGVYVSKGAFEMSGGLITNNTNTYFFGGGVYVNYGSFTMTGGTISENYAHSGGGGVSVNEGTFTMSGGYIKDNVANCNNIEGHGNENTYGGGVYAYDLYNTNSDEVAIIISGGEISGNDATYGDGMSVMSVSTKTSVSVSGSPKIVEEIDIGPASTASPVQVIGAFTPVNALTINRWGAGDGTVIATYTAGLTPNSDNFASYSDTYKTAVSGQDIVLRLTYTVAFDANGGSNTMTDVTDVRGEYTLPACGFTAPVGKRFKAWEVSGTEYAVGGKITVSADTTVKAVWEYIPHVHSVDGTSASITWTPITDLSDITGAGNYYLVSDIAMTADMTISGAVNLCLNGHKIEVTKASTEITVAAGGILSICDCSKNETGIITSERSDKNILNNGTVNLYSGTIERNDHTPAIENASGATFNMYGGKISGTCQGVKNNGTVKISGGFISTNRSAIETYAGEVNISGSASLDTTSSGYATLSFYGGTVNVNGGTIKNEQGSHAVYTAASANGTINISGGKISASGKTNTLRLTSANTAVNITGGSITNTYDKVSYASNDGQRCGWAIDVIDVKSLTISGAPAIDSIYLAKDKTITVGEGGLSNTTPIPVYCRSCPAAVTGQNSTDYSSKFTPKENYAGTYQIVNKDNVVWFTKEAAVTYTDGVDGEEVFADQDYNAYLGFDTPAFVGTPKRTGYNFTGWSPEIAETVEGYATYAAQWTEKAEISIDETAQTYTYDENDKAFAIIGDVTNGFTVTYAQNGSAVTPNNAGTYDVIITRAEDDTYKAYSKTLTGALVIDRKAIDSVSGVTSPLAADAAQTTVSGENYSGTVAWDPDVTTFGYYTAYTATVTLTADDNYKFADGITVGGYTAVVSGNGTTLTLTKTFDKTAKAKITSVTAPSVTELGSYFASVDDAIKTLPATIEVETEAGKTTLPISWEIVGTYAPTPEMTNTFKWTADIGDYDGNGQTVSGTVSPTNADYIGVSNSAAPAEIIYDGSTFDVSTMFTKDTNAGEASYEVVVLGTEGEGAGTLGTDGKTLTITKAGVITVKMTTEAIGAYGAGSAQTTLTVNAGAGIADVTIEGWTYGENAKIPVPTSTTNGTDNVTYLYESSDDKGYRSDVAPTDAGAYKVTATFAATDLYAKATDSAEFTIERAVPSVKTEPEASKIKKGRTLEESEITDGVMLGADGKPLAGTFTWKAPDTVLETKGTHEAVIVFTPSDAVNYTAVEITVNVRAYITTDNDGTYTVRFKVNGADPIDSQIVKAGGKATKPTDPEKDGYTFDGWYTDVACTDKFSFSAKITSSITLYAKWIEEDETSSKWNNGFNGCRRNSTCPIYPFTDASTNTWYHDGVHFCLDNDLMVGYPDNIFKPDTAITRAMVVTMLWRFEGEPVVNYLMRFEDVDQEAWYAEAVRWASAEGIVEGYDEKTFAPDDNITREQLATMLYRYMQKKGGGFTGAWMFLLDFTDRGEVSEWAYEAVCYMTMHGLIQGKNDNILDPKGNATRAEVATIFQRYCGSIEK